MIYRNHVTAQTLDAHLTAIAQRGETIIAIVPLTLTMLGASPKRYEVTEFLVISRGN